MHNLTPDETLKAVKSTRQGLTDDEATSRLCIWGANTLPQPPQRHVLMRFFSHFHNILIYVLLAAAGTTAALGHVVDTTVIITVVIINATIGFYQEGQAEKAMQAIQQMLALRASVLRQGKRKSIPAEALVPGDIVFLDAGDTIPADMRFINTHSLYVQESILTGESVAVEKHISAVSLNAPLGDRFCLGFSGTTVTSGQGQGVVIATGAKTEIGRIGGLLSKVQPLQTPLVSQITVFSRWLTLFILAVTTLLFLFGFFILQHDFASLFMVVVGVAVAAIPEGLPAVLTITLAVGVKAMAKRNAIVRRLPAIETLGSVSVICSDKTGTLTRNEMMVDRLVIANQCLCITGEGYEPIGTIVPPSPSVDMPTNVVLQQLGQVATLCNDAELIEKQGCWTGVGDPMELALLAFAAKAGVDSDALRKAWTRTDAIPFDSSHKFMATLNHDHDGHAFIFVKGAPEIILRKCTQQQDSMGGIRAADHSYWEQKANAIASQGRRVLALAVKAVPAEHTVLEHQDISSGLVCLALVGLIDPPRQEAIDAIAQCHTAGIEVKMITGDHAGTASAIAKQLGLRHCDRVLTGQAMDQLNDAELNALVRTTGIFARTSPEHKLRLIMALQANDMTVAMTGDGVNDAPALKRAEVGVAMGLTGSEAAKQAADIVLADDNFSSIVAAVREGRTVYDNIKKVISWTLPTNAGEAMTIIFALLMGLSLPITPVQILWINMITAVTLGIALAFEPTEQYTMQKQPRARHEALLNTSLIWHILLVTVLFICGVFGLYEYAMLQGYSEALARTIAMNTLVVLEIFHLFFIRNMYSIALNWQALLGTRVVWLAVGAVVVCQFSITYLPVLQAVFQTEAVSALDGLLIILSGAILFCILETEKQIRLRLASKKT